VCRVKCCHFVGPEQFSIYINKSESVVKVVGVSLLSKFDQHLLKLIKFYLFLVKVSV
jgi:hypothetical protein